MFYRVFHEPTAGNDIYEGKFKTFQDATNEAMKHFKWAVYYNKALYIQSSNGDIIYLNKGNR